NDLAQVIRLVLQRVDLREVRALEEDSPPLAIARLLNRRDQLGLPRVDQVSTERAPAPQLRIRPREPVREGSSQDRVGSTVDLGLERVDLRPRLGPCSGGQVHRIRRLWCPSRLAVPWTEVGKRRQGRDEAALRRWVGGSTGTFSDAALGRSPVAGAR